MPMVPYEPFRQLDQLRREMDRFFTGDLPSLLRNGFTEQMGTPSIDTHETDKEVIASCDIPGLEKKEDVTIRIDRHMLTVGGIVKRVHEVQSEHMHRQERFAGRFQRSVQLPAKVSAEGVRATYKNGVLEIRMPKLQADTEKTIDVEFH